MHRVYMAYHIVFALMALWLRPKLFVKQVRYGLIIFLTVYAVLLASRNLTVFLFLFYIVMGLLNIKSFWKNKKILIGSLISAVAIIWLMSHVPIIERYARQLTTRQNLEESYSKNDLDGVTVRLIIWQHVWQLIKEKPVTGYGIPDGQLALKKSYAETGYVHGIIHGHHAHNLYLGVWLESGLVGLLAVLATLFVPLFSAIKKGKKLYVALAAMTAFVSISEPVIYLHQGIIMFMLFASLLFFEQKILNKQAVQPADLVI